ncbi:MAG TPA: hypothetical protein VG899_13825, partial [Mycobacteriales bacterium]|nr:hypothetical protein [Mycobacteriales bacterium]
SKVLFGSSTAVTDFSVNPAGTQITVTSPAHAAASVNVFVVTPGGTSAVVAGDHFTYKKVG